MANPTGVWGIDIGQCALKALRLELIDGHPTATAFDYIEHPKILSQPDADPDALTREALEKFLSRNPIGKDQVAISIAGQSGLVRFVKLPPVEEKKVGDIVKFEAKQQIPFPLDEVVWDYQKIAGGEAVSGFAMETEIGLFAMKRVIINKYLGHYQAVGAEVHVVQMAPLALVNFATYELLKKGGPDEPSADAAAEGEEEVPRGKKRCTVVLDIGTDSSNLIITDGGKVIWQRPIPLGGNHFTRALTKEMKLTFAKAEHLKRNAAKSPDLAQILRALRPVLTEFVGEVQRSLGYFTNTHRDAHVAHLVGLGSAFRLPGLQKYLSEKLALEVKKPARFQRLSGEQVLTDPTFQENLLSFPVAYGLALQGVGLARLQTSLLPSEVRVERLIRAKKPAVALAAAAMLLGTGALAFGYGVELSGVSDPSIDKAMKTADSAIKSSQNQDSQRAAAEKEIADLQQQVKAIIVGNDERLNWIRMHEVLTAALPRPGYYETKNGQMVEVAGTNLTEPSQVPFWSSAPGQRAYQKYRERLGSGVPVDKLFDDDLSNHLATVNIESADCRYTDNLGNFLTAADNTAKTIFGLDIANDLKDAEREKDETTQPPRFKPKAVEGGGWVFELRGYTNHESGVQFLRECLVRNLKKFDDFAAKTPGGKKVGEIIAGGVDPVSGEKNGISHVFLLFSKRIDNPVPNQFVQINKSWITPLTMGASAGMAGGAPGMPGGSPSMGSPAMGSPAPGGEMAGGLGAPGGMAGGAGSTIWRPVPGSLAARTPPAQVSTTTTGGMGGMGVPGGYPPGVGGPMGLPGGAESQMPYPSSGPGGVSPYPGGSATPQQRSPRMKVHPRYEFVVCFIWREPTPTDPTPTAETAVTQ
jgi:type IV pilus assembly protein PilM